MTDLSFKKSLLYFSIALLILELIVYKDFIFGNYYFLYKDLGDDYYTLGYPEFYAKLESLKNGQIPSWSFHTALGENKYPGWLEPIALSISYLFFKDNLVASFIWIQITYIFLAGVIMFLFFRNSKFHFLPSAIGAILYVFSGYVLGCSTWYLEYSQQSVLIAFVLFSTQLFLHNKSLYLLPFAIALVGITSTVILFYFSFLLLVFYLVLNIELVYKDKQTLKNLFKFSIACLLGLGLSSGMVWSNLYLINNSARGSGMYQLQETLINSPIRWIDKNELSTSVLRLFSNNMQGVADSFKGWYNYFEAPFWYCGLICLILIPQLFHFLNRRNKIIYGSVIVFFIVIVVFPYLRYAIWVFSGNYYRVLSFIFGVILILFSTQALHFIIIQQKVYIKTLAITFVGLILLLLSHATSIFDEASPKFAIIIGLLLVYSALLFFYNKQDSKKTILYVLFGIICLEMISFANTTLTERKIITTDDFKKGKGYNDITKAIVSDLKKRDNSFYRMEKDYFSGVSRVASYNDAQAQGFYGSAGYSAFHNANYIRFLQSIDALYIEGELGSRFVKGIREIPEAMQICGVKYFISNQDSITKYQTNFNLIKEENGHKVYQLKNNLPLGFTYSQYITENNFDKLTTQQKRALLNKAIVVDKDFANELKDLKPFNSNEISQIQHNFFKIKSFSNNEIKGNIDVKQAEILFFSIPYDEGWKITVNEKIAEKQRVFHGLTGIYLPKGNHKINLIFEAPFKKIGTIITLISLFITALLYFLNSKRNFL